MCKQSSFLIDRGYFGNENPRVSAQFDVICVGRVSADIYPLQAGVGLHEVESFGKFLGGSAANVAVAASRLGMRTALISHTGEDPFGKFVQMELAKFGVDPRYVTPVDGMQTPVTFCEVFPPDNFPLYFYQSVDVPYFSLRADELDLDAIRSAKVYWATLTGLAQEPSREAHHAAWRARGRTANTVLDMDYRARFWPSKAEAMRELRRALPRVSVAIGNAEECAIATGQNNPVAAARALLDMGVELAIVKQGSLGALGMTQREAVMAPALKVETLNGLGAGDAFGGALCHGLVHGWPLERMLRFASAAGAIVATRLECANAMPTVEEVEGALASGEAPNREANK